jgi:hypothetical protein
MMMMSVVLLWLASASLVFGDPNSPLFMLLTSVVLGAVTYTVAIGGLWILAGKLPGPEAYIVERAMAFFHATRPKS